MDNAYDWYAALIKPSWAPPSWLFGPVWTLLYALIAISFGKVLVMTIRKEIPFSVFLPFLINIVANAIFTPLQFGYRSNIAASLDILLVLATLVWAMIVIYPYKRWIAYMQVPYLLWVTFASVLQLSITFLNI